MNLLQLAKERYSDKFDEDYFIWYLMYAYESMSNQQENTDKHHILPKCHFPEFTNLKINEFNCAQVSRIDHIILHYLLAKSTDEIKLWLAVRILARTSTNDHTSIIKSIQEMIKNGTPPVGVPAFDPNDITKKMLYVKLDDPRYTSGNLVHNKTGSTHKESTKQLMSKNGVKDKLCIYEISNPNNLKFICDTETLPEGFNYGNPNIGIIVKDRLTNTEHWHDSITNASYRIKPGETIPDGAIKGRIKIKNNPFNRIILKNFKTGETVYADELIFPIYCGTPVSKNAYIFNGKITFNINTLIKYFPDNLSKSIISKLIYNTDSKIHHHKVSAIIRPYLKQFANYSDIPIEIIPINSAIHLISSNNWLQ